MDGFVQELSKFMSRNERLIPEGSVRFRPYVMSAVRPILAGVCLALSFWCYMHVLRRRQPHGIIILVIYETTYLLFWFAFCSLFVV